MVLKSDYKLLLVAVIVVLICNMEWAQCCYKGGKPEEPGTLSKTRSPFFRGTKTRRTNI